MSGGHGWGGGLRTRGAGGADCGPDPLGACGCCDGVHVVTPVALHNRPGLDALAYRVGTHGRFLATMLARLSSADRRALAGLRTRERGDLSIALLDGWATVADVLAFYQERIANEGYLRTATERRSVLELARLIGYTPRPGLSASVYLAYTLEPGYRLEIPAGTKVQSVPGPGELPQSFETSEPLAAAGGFSALPPRRSRPQAVLAPTAGSLKQLVLAGTAAAGELRPGDIVRATGPDLPPVVLFEASAVTADPVLGTTTVGVALHPRTPVPGPPAPPEGGPFDAVVPAQAFGVSEAAAAPAMALVAKLGAEDGDDEHVVNQLRDLYSEASTWGETLLTSWLAMVVDAGEAFLASRSEGGILSRSATVTAKTRLGLLVDALRKPASIPPPASPYLRRDVSAIYSTQSGTLTKLLEVLVPAVKDLLGPALANTAEQGPSPLSFARMKVKAALFGHQTSTFPVYVDGEVKGFTDPMTIRAGENQPSLPTQFHPPDYAPDKDLLLDAVYDGIRPGASIVLVNPALTPPVDSRLVTAAEPVSATAFGISGRVTKLTLDAEWPTEEDTSLAAVLRGTQVLAQPVPLALAEVSIDDEDVRGDVVELAGLHLDLAPGRFVTVSGERTDDEIREVQGPSSATQNAAIAVGRPPSTGTSTGTGVPGVELAMISSVEHRAARLPDGRALPGDTVHTFVKLARPLAYRYRRPTVALNANVVKATHGATSREVLGAGDGAKRFQMFPLRQPPLTYLPVPTSVGARSALAIWVNDVQWHESEDLLGAGPADRRFVVRTDDDGQTAVVFGDGERGARLPSGLENVRAVYRTGLGRGGNVGAGSITIAVDRPLGVKEVVNPLPATGGADRETRDQARRNAPIAIQALDRLVSVQDYADFARTFAGIGSASADELSDGRRQLVHVTITGIDEAPIATSSDLYRNLLEALVVLGDPFHPVELAIRELRALVVQARIRTHPDHHWDTVEPAVRAALLDHFGAHRRELGQDVVQGDVLATIQAVPGVVFVQLLILDAVSEEDLAHPDPAAGLGLRSRVTGPRARRVRGPAGSPDVIAPAELVVLSATVPDTLILSELP